MADEKIERRVDLTNMNNMVKEIHTAIYGSNSKGLKVQVYENKKDIKFIKRIGSLGIGAIITLAITYIRSKW